MNNVQSKAGEPTIRERLRSPRFWAYLVSISVVTAIAALNSYMHQAEVALWLHSGLLAAYTAPLSVDGLLGAATLAMADDKAMGRLPRRWARFAFWLGAAVSVAANIASVAVSLAGTTATLPIVVGAVLWNSWPPIALLVLVEIMSRPGRVPPPAKNPVRVEGGRRAAQTRKAKAATPTRKPRTPRAPAAAQVSPATVSEIDDAMTV